MKKVVWPNKKQIINNTARGAGGGFAQRRGDFHSRRRVRLWAEHCAGPFGKGLTAHILQRKGKRGKHYGAGPRYTAALVCGAHVFGYENKVRQDLETIVENRRLQDLIQEVRVPTETVVDAGPAKRRNRSSFPAMCW